jgi:signal transduction histidine kinase
MASVGHRLAIEMERATPAEQAERWRTVIGPVFQTIWPLDVELQTTKGRARFLSIMQEQARRMARLIDDLLSLSRIELNAHRRPDAPVDLTNHDRVCGEKQSPVRRPDRSAARRVRSRAHCAQCWLSC